MANAKQNLGTWIAAGLLIAAAAALYLRFGAGETAPKPSVFAESVSLDEAVGKAAAEDRVVFAVATADWCGPCQVYKRNALVDERVVAWLSENAVPVYIDVDAQPEAAQRLGVSAIPATFVIAGGEVEAAATGALSADQLLSMLDETRQRLASAP